MATIWSNAQGIIIRVDDHDDGRGPPSPEQPILVRDPQTDEVTGQITSFAFSMECDEETNPDLVADLVANYASYMLNAQGLSKNGQVVAAASPSPPYVTKTNEAAIDSALEKEIAIVLAEVAVLEGHHDTWGSKTNAQKLELVDTLLRDVARLGRDVVRLTRKVLRKLDQA